MKKTKDRILDTALELFNSQGLSKTTIRSIANEMGISHGNLNYYYKKREEIIEVLYFQLVNRIENTMLQIQHEKTDLSLLLNISSSVITDFYAYRFILIDFGQIIREHDKIKEHYVFLKQVREQQFLNLLNLLIENNVVRSEKLPNEYQNLFKRVHILGYFWIPSIDVLNRKITKKDVNKYSEMMSQLIFPYLTEKGVEQYLLIVNDGKE